MSYHVENASEIPDAALYVTATDTFLSNWEGTPSEGKRNVVVLLCDSPAEAETVAEYARTRSDMRNVRIRRSKPPQQPGVLWSIMDKGDAGRWYQGA